jgi:hypothetical protein
VLVSSFYRCAPEGTTFAVPATVRIQVTATPPAASVYWSRASGGGYDALATTWSGATASASITHFGHAFVGLVATGDAGAEGDATSPDGLDGGRSAADGASADAAPEASVDAAASSDAGQGDAGGDAAEDAVADDASDAGAADADVVTD